MKMDFSFLFYENIFIIKKENKKIQTWKTEIKKANDPSNFKSSVQIKMNFF